MRPAAQIAGPAAGHSVGQGIARLDGPAKLDGTESYGADHWPDGALVVRAVRSPHAAAGFVLGDLAGWAAARNVLVFTASDIPGVNRFGVIPAFADQPALAEGQVRFRGEAVALVAGEAEAMAGLDLSDFPATWDAMDAVLDTAPGARAVLAERPDNVLIRGRVVRGDAEAGFARAAHVAEVSVETAHVEHAYIEPEAGVAWMEGDTLVIRACTQAPVMDRDDTARILGLAPEQVRIIPSAVGGGFGSKLDMSLQPLIGLVALKTGRPARMVYSRRESMQSTTKRHPARMTARIGADASGRITGMTFDGTFDTGPYSSWGPTVANRVPVHASGPYFVPDYRAEAKAVHTNGPVSGAFRGFGVPQAAVAQELAFDDLALALGIDRLDFRRRERFAGRASHRLRAGPDRRRDRGLPCGAATALGCGAGRGCSVQCGTCRSEARDRRRLLLVWLRQHRPAQPLDRPCRDHGRWQGRPASGCHGYRAGVEHRHQPRYSRMLWACRSGR